MVEISQQYVELNKQISEDYIKLIFILKIKIKLINVIFKQTCIYGKTMFKASLNIQDVGIKRQWRNSVGEKQIG